MLNESLSVHAVNEQMTSSGAVCLFLDRLMSTHLAPHMSELRQWVRMVVT